MTAAWTCSSCAMTVSYVPGAAVPEHPPGWWVCGAGWRCLSCRREAAVAVALEQAGEGRRERQVRGRALAEFELRRDPSRSDAAVAKVIRTTPSQVKAIRRELAEAGAIRVATVRRRRAALRAAGELPAAEVGR